MKNIQSDSNDVANLETAKKARDIMKQALSQNKPDVYNSAFKRYCVLVSAEELKCKDNQNPVISKFWEMMAALEQIYFEKYDWNVKAIRTRTKVKKYGELKVLEDWALSKTYTIGFRKLYERGLLQLTGEYIIVTNSDKFDSDIVIAAQHKLNNFKN